MTKHETFYFVVATKKLAMKERYSTQHNSDSVAFSNEKKTFLLPTSKDYIEDMDMSLSLSASLKGTAN